MNACGSLHEPTDDWWAEGQVLIPSEVRRQGRDSKGQP